MLFTIIFCLLLFVLLDHKEASRVRKHFEILSVYISYLGQYKMNSEKYDQPSCSSVYVKKKWLY